MIENFIKFLNDLLAMDPDLVQKLADTHYTCNQEVADHPTIMVFSKEHAAERLGTDGTEFKVRFLGILNGFLLQENPGSTPVAVEFDDESGKVLRFTTYKKKENEE